MHDSALHGTDGSSTVEPCLFKEIGIDTKALAAGRRTFCRACLDWSERRHHLADALGAALLDRLVEMGWAKREPASRVIDFSKSGEKHVREFFQLPATT